MIFRADLAAKILAGEKTETRRQMSDNPRSPWFRGCCAIEPGRRYAVCPGRGEHAIAHIVVHGVDRSQLGNMDHAGAVAEGFPDFEHFTNAWALINGGKWDPREWVWRIRFTLDELAP